MLQVILSLLVFSVGHVHHNQQGRRGDEDQLQGPEPDVGDGEEIVEADVGAARLPGVAVKIFLIITPHFLCRHYINQHSEDEDNR